jgi:hypothetical protein
VDRGFEFLLGLGVGVGGVEGWGSGDIGCILWSDVSALGLLKSKTSLRTVDARGQMSI